MTSTIAPTAPHKGVPVSNFDPYVDEVLANPYPHYEQLRAAGAVVWLERYGVYVLARHQQVESVLRDPVTFCSGAGVGLANFHTEEPWRKPSLILEADPPAHGRIRKVVGRILSPAFIGKFRPAFEAEAEKLVDKVLGMGSFDAVPQFCEAFPLKVFADAVGLPPNGREHLLPYGDMVFNGFGPINERFKTRLAAAQASIAWIGEVCKRENLTDGGLGDALYQAAADGEILPDEAPMLVRTLLSAGLDTTVFALCNAMSCFARHPDQWAQVHANPSMARSALEEVLRYESVFHSFYRTTTKPVEIEGVPMDAEQKILVFIASANRDPQRWERADTFDVQRRAAGNMAFGTGIHGCAGQMMSRLEGEILLSALARKVKAIRLDAQPVLHLNNSVRGYTSMPVTITPA